MLKYFLDAFRITNNNIIFATPLILFMLLVSLYQGILSGLGFNIWLVLLGLVTLLLMWAAFLSGAFYVVREAVLIDGEDISKEEKVKKSFGLVKAMLKGVGEYFFSFVGALILFVILFFVYISIVRYIGVATIGAIEEAMVLNLTNVSEIDMDDLSLLLQWSLLGMITFLSFLYVSTLCAAEIIKNTKNVLKACFNTLKFFFKKFFRCFAFGVLIIAFQFIVMIACGLLGAKLPIMSYVSLLVYFYLLIYVVVLVFLFYEREDGNAQTKAEGDCGCGSDCIGQDCICDKSGEED